jgi:hypothetical protein
MFVRRSARLEKIALSSVLGPNISVAGQTQTDSRPKKSATTKAVVGKATTARVKSKAKTKSKAKAVPAQAMKSTNDHQEARENMAKRAKPASPAELETLKQISDTLHQQNSHSNVSTKPDPIGGPSVWSSSRQALCETLHYFRSYQGGCYANQGIVRAFLFDKSPFFRDYMDSDVIVARTSGGMSANEAGEMVLSKDAVEKSHTISLRNTIAHSNPVAVIVSDVCQTSPSKMPQVYNVLGWYKPTDVWYEKHDDKKIIRFRLEKLRASEPGWWTPKDVIPPTTLGDLSPPVGQDCDKCGKFSLQMYLNGWICLDPDCVMFWKFSNSMEPDDSSLRYDPRWLKQFTPWLNSNDPEPIRPIPFVPVDGDPATASMSTRACRGRVCDCGACILRVKWKSWECCGEGGCGRSYPLPPSETLVPLSKLEDVNFPKSSKSPSISRAAVNSSAITVTEIPNDLGGFKIVRYDLHGTNSSLWHLTAGLFPIQEPGGPDDMWKSLQQSPPDLIRQELSSSFGKNKKTFSLFNRLMQGKRSWQVSHKPLHSRLRKCLLLHALVSC